MGNVSRIWDPIKINKAVEHFLGPNDIDIIEWLADSTNIVFENSQGDLALFEYGLPTKAVYSGHYYFNSRGRQAIKAGKEFLDELFNSCYNINIVMGMVPIERREVKWITRQLGFKSYGPEEARGKQYELFILTKREFNNEHTLRGI